MQKYHNVSVSVLDKRVCNICSFYLYKYIWQVSASVLHCSYKMAILTRWLFLQDGYSYKMAILTRWLFLQDGYSHLILPPLVSAADKLSFWGERRDYWHFLSEAVGKMKGLEECVRRTQYLPQVCTCMHAYCSRLV